MGKQEKPGNLADILWNKVLTPRNLVHGAAVLLLFYLLLLLLRPLADPDLWWHLKTGEWIVTEQSLPGGEDPFSYTTPPLSAEEIAGRQSQWLGEAFFYLSYLVGSLWSGGYLGVVLLRACLILAPFIYLYLRYSAGHSINRVHPALLLPAIAFSPLIVAFSLYYSYERPQAFSFLLSLIVVILLKRDDEKPLFNSPLGKGGTQGGKEMLKLALLPPVMLLWGNLHGGYIVGAGLILLFMAGEAGHLLAHKAGMRAFSPPRKDFGLFFAACGLGLLASGINPGGFRLLGLLADFPGRLFGGGGESLVITEVAEYKSLWYFYTVYHLKWPLFIAAYIGLALVSLVLKYLSDRKIRMGEALAFMAVGIFGFLHSRGIGFALPLCALVICASILKTRGRARLFLMVLSFALSAGLVFYVWSAERWRLKPEIPSGPDIKWVNTDIYPEGAVRFIEERKIAGPMFNEMRWGGYLIWRLYSEHRPEYRVFFDSRQASARAMDAYLSVIDGSPAWQATLDAFDVNFALIQVMQKEIGAVSGLMLRLMEEKPDAWRLVYLWDNEALFVRNHERNRDAIDCCEMSYEELYYRILDLSDGILASSPGHPNALLSKAIALYGLGRYDEAGRILSSIPETPLSRSYIERLPKGR